eukprot:m.453809 g.453809  ORF g.453809 m.453809 type:complete len:70 (-) comp21556_c0_seq3:6-215(-)
MSCRTDASGNGVVCQPHRVHGAEGHTYAITGSAPLKLKSGITSSGTLMPMTAQKERRMSASICSSALFL